MYGVVAVVASGDGAGAAGTELTGDRHRDAARDRTQVAQRGVQGTLFEAVVGDEGGQRARRHQEDHVGDPTGLGSDSAEADTGEDEHVVGLAEHVEAPVALDRCEGTSVATSARPPVQSKTSPGVASQLDVGFESGKTMGAAVAAAIVRRAVSVKAPATPLVPSKMVGATLLTTSSRLKYVPDRGGPLPGGTKP